MSEPINHHYLPVFYLRQWAGADGKVVRYYRPHKKVVGSWIKPSNTGYEPLLYTLEGYPQELRAKIEQDYMGPAVDGPAAEAMRILMERADPHPMSEVRSAWTRFLMASRLRTPEMVAYVVNEGRNRLRQLLETDPEEYEAVRGESDPPTLLGWADEHVAPWVHNVGKLLLPDLIENQQIGDAIIKMRWSIINLATSRFTLLTSDRPFVMTDGLSDKKCVIAFPMAPRLAFVAVHDAALTDHLLSRGVDHFAKCLNAHVVDQAIRHVYGSTMDHLRFVQNRLRVTPRETVLGR